MALAVALANLIASLAPIVAKLFVGGMSVEEASKQSTDALAKFAADLRKSEAADAERDKATDAALDAIDASKKFDTSDVPTVDGSPPEIIR